MSRAHVLVVSPGFGTRHRGSFVQTHAGFVAGLRAHGIAVTTWDADAASEDGDVPRLAGVTQLVVFGPPTGQQWLRLLLVACERLQIPAYWMLAANSRTLPPGVLGFLKAYPWLRILTPSVWSATAIHDAIVAQPWGTDQQATALVVPHGVEVPADVPAPDPRFAHPVAGTTGRKGTEELLEAVRDNLPLVIYADATALPWVSALADGKPLVEVRRAYNGDAIPAWWRHQRIIQPSRAEGFGLCAVEASLLGRLVVMRRDTGEPELSSAILLGQSDVEWEGGDGPLTHPSGLDPLWESDSGEIRAVIEAYGMFDVARTYAPLEDPDRFLFSVAIEPFVRTVQTTA